MAKLRAGYFLLGGVLGVVGVFGGRGGPARLFAFSSAIFPDFFAFATTFALRSFANAAFDGLAFFAWADFFARFAARDFLLFLASNAFVRFVMALLFCGRCQRSNF